MCTLHDDPSRPSFQQEKSFASCGAQEWRGDRAAVTSGRTLFPILDGGKHLSSPFFLGRLSLALPALPLVLLWKCRKWSAPPVRDNKAILLFITGRLTSRAPADRRENGTLDRTDGAAADHCAREWKNGSEPRDAREKNLDEQFPRGERAAPVGRTIGWTNGRRFHWRKNSFSFCGSADSRDRCERGATGTRERPGESIIPDVQRTFQ